MRRTRKKAGETDRTRPKVTMRGVGAVLGLHKATVYRRINNGDFSLDGVPFRVTTRGILYDLEGVFHVVFPSAEKETINMMMFAFMQNNRGLIK